MDRRRANDDLHTQLGWRKPKYLVCMLPWLFSYERELRREIQPPPLPVSIIGKQVMSLESDEWIISVITTCCRHVLSCTYVLNLSSCGLLDAGSGGGLK